MDVRKRTTWLLVFAQELIMCMTQVDRDLRWFEEMVLVGWFIRLTAGNHR